MSLLFSRNQVVLAKVETTAGTDATPTGSDAILCEVINPTVEGDSLENNVVRSSISAQPTNYINKKVKATIVVRAKGSGDPDTPPEFAPLLKSCALKENIVSTEGSECVEYTPANTATNMKTCTIYIYKDGLLVKAVGCMGNMRFSGRYSEYPSLEFEMEGLFAGISDASNPTPTYDATEPVEMKSEGFAFGSCGDAVAREFGFETGNTLVSRGNINSATGLMPYIITERDPKWSSTVEAVLEATNSFWGDYQNRTTVALSLTHGSTSGNIVMFEASKANFDAPTFSEESSLNMYGLSGQLLETSGEDNFKLTFK
jgi:hypothetical protein